MHVCVCVCVCVGHVYVKGEEGVETERGGRRSPTFPVPLIKEMRFRQTGRRIRMMLKFIGSDGPLANASASCKKKHKQPRVILHV